MLPRWAWRFRWGELGFGTTGEIWVFQKTDQKGLCKMMFATGDTFQVIERTSSYAPS